MAEAVFKRNEMHELFGYTAHEYNLYYQSVHNNRYSYFQDNEGWMLQNEKIK